MTTSAYPKILQLGDRSVADIFSYPVEITEKIDGSQFGFGVINGDLVMRSHGRDIYAHGGWLTEPDKLFAPAVDHISHVCMTRCSPCNGYFFYGETLAKPRHSTLAYERVPRNHIALFAVRNPDGSWQDYAGLQAWGEQLDVDVVPRLFNGENMTADRAIALLDTESYLGGQKIEGIVIKAFTDWLFLGRQLEHVMAAKYVSERFKETHKETWRYNTTPGGIDRIKAGVRTEARWMKAVQHLRDRGEFTGSVSDIGPLIREVNVDLEAEEAGAIKDALYDVFRKDILRSATGGLAEWFKLGLAEGLFELGALKSDIG